MKKLLSFVIILFIIINFGSINVFSKINDFNYNNVKYNNWNIEVVDSLGETGWYSNININDDISYISYYDRLGGNLKFAKRIDKEWILDVVDSLDDVGKFSSIDIDSFGNQHISYFDETNKDLKYAEWTGSKWNIEIVDSIDDVGYDSSIAIDQEDNIHISYYDSSNGDLKYAKKTDSSWIIEVVDSNGIVGAGSSMDVDLNNNPHISYSKVVERGLLYAHKDELGWSTEIVDDNCKKVFGSTSIDLDSKSLPHIAYFDVGTLDEIWYLKYAYMADGGWNIEVIDPDIINFWYDWGVSIATGIDDIVHIAYYKWPGRDLNYAWRLNNIWSIETVDFEGAVGSFCSIDIKNNRYPSICYMDRSNLNLKYADKNEYSPSKPEKPIGSIIGLSGKNYTFTTSAIDYDENKISYGWDWGENKSIEWTEYYDSNKVIYQNHSWNNSGIFQIKVKARDENGNEGNWSEFLNFRIIRKHNKMNFFNYIIGIIS
jgi:hypothetical protein